MSKEAMKQALDFLRSGHFVYPTKIATDLEEALAKQEQGEPIGVMVSMDVSKGDEPEHRIFGRIYEVQEDSDGVTYLAIEESRNFEAKQEQGEPYGYFRYDMRLDAWVQSRDSDKGVAFYTTPQPKQEHTGEPVGYTDEHGNAYQYGYTGPKFAPNIQLYTTPYVATQRQQREPLTDEQINAISDEYLVDYRIPAGCALNFARDVEAAHGIKE